MSVERVEGCECGWRVEGVGRVYGEGVRYTGILGMYVCNQQPHVLWVGECRRFSATVSTYCGIF